MIEHCALETYSVLTRLPPPHRCSAGVVRDFLRVRFVEPFLRMDGRLYKDFVLALPEHAVTGGAAYDALVAATAAAHSASLITCDRRAALVYESYGLRATFIG
jgi:predicted nucleic acid-binding protein